MLTFVSGYETLDVLGDVLVEVQLAYIQWLDHCAVIQHQKSRVPAHLLRYIKLMKLVTGNLRMDWTGM